MGMVYLAQGSDGRAVALKVIRAELARDRVFLRRFQAEVEHARQVEATYTAKVVKAVTDTEMPYLVTEFIEGPTLESEISFNGPLSPANAKAVAIGTAAALIAIHNAGIVHRDLKPANVILSYFGPRVIDFGIARSLGATTNLTRTGLFLGTPAYMSPEQLEHEDVTTASDIFSWGGMIAYAVTGRQPFGGVDAHPYSVMFQIVNGTPRVDGVPDELRPLVIDALAKVPAARPTARQLLARLVGGAAVENPSAVADRAISELQRDDEEGEDRQGEGGSAQIPRGDRHSAARPVLAPSRSPAAVGRPWRLHIGGAPAPAYGVPGILVGSTGQVAALNEADGQPLWRRKLPLLKGAAPVVEGDRVLVAGGDSRLWSLDAASGESRWWADLQAAPTAAPTVAGDIVAVPTEDGYVSALDLSSGHRRWRKRLSQPVHGPIAADERTLYFGGHDCHIRAWTTGGTELWAFQTRKWFDASPAIGGDNLFVGGYDRRLYRLDRATGALHWYYPAGGMIKGTPAAGGGLVVFGAYDGIVYALDARTGALRWTYQVDGAVKASPVLPGTVVYVAARDGILHAIDARNGRQRWHYVTGGALDSTPVLAGQLLVVGSNDGYVYALDAKSGRGPSL